MDVERRDGWSKTIWLLGVVAGGMVLESTSLRAETPYQVGWAAQLGTSAWDQATAANSDGAGNVFFTGWTQGSLGAANAGSSDAFLAKYNETGAQQWVAQLGSSGTDQSFGVGTDGLENAYIAGTTTGALGGSGSGKIFLAKYDGSGTKQWVTQTPTATTPLINRMHTDAAGTSYVAGAILDSQGGMGFDGFLLKYDASGSLQWTKRYSVPGMDERASDVATDSAGTNVYITGSTEVVGSGQWGVFLAKYDSAGAAQWSVQFASGTFDLGTGVCTDYLGNIYVTGSTSGSPDGLGSSDVFLRKFNDSGVLQWTRFLGSSGEDGGVNVSADSEGNIFVGGDTSGLLGATSTGGKDVFLAKYDSNGDLKWVTQTGDGASGNLYDMAMNATGRAFLVGGTAGAYAGEFAGGVLDAYLVSFAVPEPGTLGLMVLSGMVLLKRRGRQAAEHGNA